MNGHDGDGGHDAPATVVSLTRDRPAPTEVEPQGPLRVAIVATPRTGNTWVRRVLADVLDLEELPVHHPADLDWGRLPDRCAVQLHWPRTLELERHLRRDGVVVVSPARHPLDVLLSTLVFAQRDPSPGEWLGGHGASEHELLGARPSSDAFLRWATGPRAVDLLAVTVGWWEVPTAIPVRYEALSADPEGAFATLLGRIGRRSAAPLDVAVRANSPRRLRDLSGGTHVWQARPGLWREVLPWSVVEHLVAAHGGVFAALGYSEPVPEDLAEPRPWTPIPVTVR